MYRYLVVWYNPKNHTYYHKILKHNYNSYYVGYINEYNHTLILFEDISNYLYVTKNYFSFKRKLIRFLISFLNKL